MKKTKHYLFNTILIILFTFFTGCSVKKTAQVYGKVTEGAALGAVAVCVAPVAIPIYTTVYIGDKIGTHNYFSDIKNQETLISKFGKPNKKYSYNDNNIWEYKNIIIKSNTFKTNFDIFFLLKEKEVLDYYSDTEDIKEWDKYKEECIKESIHSKSDNNSSNLLAS